MKTFYITLICLLAAMASNAQDNSCRFLFYNVENLFDTIDNPSTRDEEFLPDGNRHWNSWKYQTKLNNIYKVFMAVKAWEDLSIIGLSEIENEKVLNQLLYKTPLFQYGYKVIHKDSPDERGIDVAMLYRPDDFNVIEHRYIPLVFPEDSTDKTRDLLYVKGLLFGNDTLHVFLNHWPSRYGGYSLTEPKRLAAAHLLANSIDSIVNKNLQASIIVAGDFNDEPTDKSIRTLLQEVREPELIPLSPMENEGTTKYRSQWFLFDQILASKPLTQQSNALYIEKIQVGLFPFLLQEDERYGGQKPFRTYLGPRYIGGYSDHLPVFVDILKQSKQ